MKKPKNPLMKPLFEDRFFEQFTGTHIIKSPKVAIMELIANSWDAGASIVNIAWPENDGERFSVTDNGHGMTENQFMSIFRKLSYDREKSQGLYAEIPADNDIEGRRTVFGKNGKGRFAGFAFGKAYFVKTWRNGEENTFKVYTKDDNSLVFKKQGETKPREGHGTEVYINSARQAILSEELIRSEIGMRFLVNPKFSVFLNGTQIEFSDIPKDNVDKVTITVDGIGQIEVVIIDVGESDKTTQQHGVAWLVNGRMVGECNWKGVGYQHLIDGRRTAAKKYTFIVKADALDKSKAILPDWTGFYPTNSDYLKVHEAVHSSIKEYLLELTKDTRLSLFKDIKRENIGELKKMGLVGRLRWEEFIQEVQKDCPSISESDLFKLSTILAKLENSSSQYSLISQLSAMRPDQLDNLAGLLDKWNIDAAKIVLDELEFRLQLLEQLKIKVLKNSTAEVGELQPLFHRGLWIFGPEYETIEYTSNETMTQVIQKLYGGEMAGTNIRPDFAILPDSTIGFYAYQHYDENGGEAGIDRLTIVELKKPGVSIGEVEKSQAWKYVKELINKGLITNARVTCFVLGDALEPLEALPTKQRDETVVIIPMCYDTVIARAKGRLLKLYDKVKGVPFLDKVRVDEFLLEKSRIDFVLQ
ncbi:ATP-binding protein [Hymenobacter saemangeumensis]|uniref:ATP-binding protein n=1 Tax=Hymenobacter saemangeumensis TaxID=1084522 RepID=A0ABP8I745_9BACT